MKLNCFAWLILMSLVLVPGELVAKTRQLLILRAHIPHSISTSTHETRLNSHLSLWLLESQMNSQYPLEGQRFEVVGLDQRGLDVQLEKIGGSGRVVQHKILINRLKMSVKTNKSIFLKISAN